jgi:hypothetical protein
MRHTTVSRAMHISAPRASIVLALDITVTWSLSSGPRRAQSPKISLVRYSRQIVSSRSQISPNSDVGVEFSVCNVPPFQYRQGAAALASMNEFGRME